jgi:integrase/recombinase XerD
VIAERIDITMGTAIGLSTIEAAANRWAREQQQRQHVHSLRWSRERFVQTAKDWLHFLGCLEVPKPKIVPFADRLADFAAYQRDARGLSPAAIRCQSWHVEKFLSWLGEQNRGFDNVSLEDVDAFLAAIGKQGWVRVSVAGSAAALRCFFQYAAVRGWCTASIAAGIDGPRLHAAAVSLQLRRSRGGSRTLAHRRPGCGGLFRENSRQRRQTEAVSSMAQYH